MRPVMAFSNRVHDYGSDGTIHWYSITARPQMFSCLNKTKLQLANNFNDHTVNICIVDVDFSRWAVTERKGLNDMEIFC